MKIPHPQLDRIAEGLWRFQSSGQGLHHPCNGYILHRNGEVFLVDPPSELDRAVVTAATGQASVARIFLTHVQHEHGEGAANFPNVPIHVPSGDEPLCAGLDAYKASIKIWEFPWDWEMRGNYPGHLAGAENERPLSAPTSLGSSLEAGTDAFGFTVITTPGHGKHAVTLLTCIGGERIAFCGDLVYAGGKLWNWFDADWDYGLSGGHRALVASAEKLAIAAPDILCPAHGPVSLQPVRDLNLMARRVAAVLEANSTGGPSEAINFPECDSLAPGWREISPRIHQWKTGNVIVVTSPDGGSLVVDDGLCIWEPLNDRIRKHDEVFAQVKTALGIRQIDWIIPTHYHGDHTEFIPRLAEREGARVIALDSICGPMEFPERYNLACSLPWYGTVAERLTFHEKVPDGYVLRWGGLELEFFHLGGQTKHHLGVAAEIDGQRVILAGDAWWGTAVAAAPVLCWSDADPVHGGWAYAIDRMIERKPDLLVCGHGSAIHNPMPLLHATKLAWEKQIARFLSLFPPSGSGAFFTPF